MDTHNDIPDLENREVADMDQPAGLRTARGLIRRLARKAGTGQGLVEFALVIPIFLLMTFGAVEGGRYMYFQNSVASASREAARYGSAEANLSDCAGIRDAAKRIGFFAGVTDENISIRYLEGDASLEALGAVDCAATKIDQCPYGGTSDNYRIVVDVAVPYKPLVPMVWGGVCAQSQNARTILSGVAVAGS
ncbi:MAG TPA: TadE/TadG family type IV pilus assembly protein, partial [Anaerolineaceae bacterium]|nr:TadE/TadG family type IV pilus assembly protein [Anaerolineaceae bacterium]